mmetsp:Transcript_25741/g.60168  ORF Transcript_25741/g.60168 Transcript_25741/m.60168 type:complete len:209 (+) Transcript_25741:1125-1751(+)
MPWVKRLPSSSRRAAVPGPICLPRACLVSSGASCLTPRRAAWELRWIPRRSLRWVGRGPEKRRQHREMDWEMTMMTAIAATVVRQMGRSVLRRRAAAAKRRRQRCKHSTFSLTTSEEAWLRTTVNDTARSRRMTKIPTSTTAIMKMAILYWMQRMSFDAFPSRRGSYSSWRDIEKNWPDSSNSLLKLHRWVWLMTKKMIVLSGRKVSY